MPCVPNLKSSRPGNPHETGRHHQSPLCSRHEVGAGSTRQVQAGSSGGYQGNGQAVRRHVPADGDEEHARSNAAGWSAQQRQFALLYQPARPADGTEHGQQRQGHRFCPPDRAATGQEPRGEPAERRTTVPADAAARQSENLRSAADGQSPATAIRPRQAAALPVRSLQRPRCSDQPVRPPR